MALLYSCLICFCFVPRLTLQPLKELFVNQVFKKINECFWDKTQRHCRTWVLFNFAICGNTATIHVRELGVLTACCLLSAHFPIHLCTFGFVKPTKKKWGRVFSCQDQGASRNSFVDSVHRRVCVYMSVWEKWVEERGWRNRGWWINAEQPTWILFLGWVGGCITSLLVADLWNFPSFYDGLGFQGADLGRNRCMLPGLLQVFLRFFPLVKLELKQS